MEVNQILLENQSYSTKKSYVRFKKIFNEFLKEEQRKIDQDTINSFIIYLKEKKYKVNSIKAAVSLVTKYLKYEKNFDTNPNYKLIKIYQKK